MSVVFYYSVKYLECKSDIEKDIESETASV